MGPFGVPELIIVLVIVVIIFGVGKLPEIGSSFGKGIREFKTETGIGAESTKATSIDVPDEPVRELPTSSDRNGLGDPTTRERAFRRRLGAPVRRLDHMEAKQSRVLLRTRLLPCVG